MTPRRQILCTLTAGYWLVLFVMTHLPRGQAISPPGRLGDKVVHAIAFFGLGLMVGMSVWAFTRGARRWPWVSMAILLSYAALDEVLQIPVGRDCEFLDWVADGVGAGCAVLFLSITFRLLRGRSNLDVPSAGPEPAGA